MTEPVTEHRSIASTPAFQARLRKRYAAERRFRAIGLTAIVFSAAVLAFLLITMTSNALGGFQRAELALRIDLSQSGMQIDAERLAGPDPLLALEAAGLPGAVEAEAIQRLGPDAAAELGNGAWREVGKMLIADPARLRTPFEAWLPASDALASALRGEGQPQLQPLARRLEADGSLARRFDPGFMSRADATGPQQVGIWGALKGSMLTMFVTLLMAFPIGVLAAIYLEEYASKNQIGRAHV